MSQTIQSGELVADRFEIVRFIAEGGMGEVFEAVDQVLGGRVALKFLSRHALDDPNVQRRFRREVQLARQVTHQNVCRIFDVYQHKIERSYRDDTEVLFVTMELLQGETLESYLLRHGALAEEAALPLVRQMASALDAAHQAGVIHRDFKPSNVMLVDGRDGEETRVVVTDFGLARSIAARGSGTTTTPLTGEMKVVGTADYMSPEQLRGQEVTPASDIYAFGVVIFEMVTGGRPYNAPDAMSLLTKRATEPPSSPLDHNPSLDEGWSSVILACLESEPGDRPASAHDVVAYLGGGSADVTRPIGRFDWDKKSHRRRWIALLPVVFAVLAVLVYFAFRTEPPVARFAQGVQLTTEEGLELDPAFSPDGESIAYSSNQSGSFEIYVRDLAPGGEVRQLTSDGSQSFEPAFDPAGEWIVFHSLGKGGLWLVPAGGGEARQVATEGSRPAFSPDGEWIAYQSESAPTVSDTTVPAMGQSTLRLVSRDGTGRRQLTSAGSPPGGHGAPSFSPDGEWVAFSASQRDSSDLWAVRLADGSLVRLIENLANAYDPVYDSTGRYLYFSGATRNVFGLWRMPIRADGTSGGEPEEVENLGVASLRQAAFSADGRRMAYSALLLRSNFYALPVSPAGEVLGEPRPLTRGNSRYTRPAFTDDGRRLSCDHWSLGKNSDIWTMEADGSNPVQVTVDPGSDSVSTWFPGGQRLAYLMRRADRRLVRAVDLESGEEETLATLEVDADWARLAPDGTRLAYHTRAGDISFNVRILDLSTGRRRQLTFDESLAGFPVWSPDSRWIAFQVQRGEDRNLQVMPSDGSAEPVTLVGGSGQSWAYSFSPDSDKVAFVSDRGGFWNIYWVSRSTGEERRLTDYDLLSAYVRYPAWSPRGERIVFELAESAGDIFVAEREEE